MTYSTTPSSFWSKVDKKSTEECWVWKGTLDKRGYGQISQNNKARAAHRLAYTYTYGAIPENMFVCHKCDNPPCVNPSHLFLGTLQENTADRDAKGRQVKGERVNTAKLTENQVLDILRLYKTGNYTLKDFVAIYHVNVETIRALIKGKTWKHLKVS